MTLADLSQMKLSVDLSEADIADVKDGQPATVTVNALDDQEFAAHVTNVGLTSSESSGVVTYPVTLLLDQTAKELKPGMTGSADVVVAQADGAITIPSSALTGSTVTVEENGKTAVRQVTTGLTGESSTEILSGLQAGDKVVLQTQSAASGSAGGLPSGAAGGLPGGAGAGGGLPSGGPPGGGFPGGAP